MTQAGRKGKKFEDMDIEQFVATRPQNQVQGLKTQENNDTNCNQPGEDCACFKLKNNIVQDRLKHCLFS